MPTTVCAFDLDNTLYDFIEFFGPAFRGMVSALSKHTGLDADDITSSAAKVILNKGFLEYAFLIREMPCFQDFDPDEIKALEKLASGSFARVRQKRLVVYPGVIEVLSSLYAGCVEIAAVTNAPLYQAYRRLEALKIVKFFSIIVAIENTSIPAYVLLKGNKEPWTQKKELKVVTFPRELGKPSAHPFILLRDSFPSGTALWTVGDNIGRDLLPAHTLGYKTVWAKYGCNVTEKNYSTVLALTPPAVKTHEIASSDYVPDHTAETPNDILNFIPFRQQMSLI